MISNWKQYNPSISKPWFSHFWDTALNGKLSLSSSPLYHHLSN
ncbi:hypothetical protein BTN49_1016 [Candidatus Enterovibrio escicola]|uniref:Uncharacterized protein n=1 Tax=Candidatus Enterovibrio escicola TaxID=1927127 RepID=A0A2A5T4H0_9GAMM|nr:hypothetical protein BTN49_1016 [Candidatus Enterovibrio escacola]